MTSKERMDDDQARRQPTPKHGEPRIEKEMERIAEKNLPKEPSPAEPVKRTSTAPETPDR